LAGLLISAAASTLSYAAPEQWAATWIGAFFLAATYLFALRGDQSAIPWGLSMGGLLEPEPLSWGQLFGAAGRALLTTALVMAWIVPLYAWGFRFWYEPEQPFNLARGLQLDERGLPSPDMIDLALGHLLVVAFPEEAFFRGYLQTALQRRYPSGWNLLGGGLGTGVLLTSVLFALGHFASLPNPGRLAVFFPSLLFGWLRNRTGGIGASVLTHAACNVLVVVLVQGYGLG
jgi:hypothetical protein